MLGIPYKFWNIYINDIYPYSITKGSSPITWQCFWSNLTYQINIVWHSSLRCLRDVLSKYPRISWKLKNFSQILIFGKFVKNIKKVLKHNRIIGHCETILIHLTKVTNRLKENKYGSTKGTEIHTICYQKGALLTEREIKFQSCISLLNKIHLLS